MQPTPPPNLAPFLPPPPLPPPPPAPFWFSFCCLNWESGSIMSAQCFFLLFLMSHFVGILLGPPCYSLESLSLSLSLSFFFGLNLCSVLPCVSGPSSPRRSPRACSESLFLYFSLSCCLSPASSSFLVSSHAWVSRLLGLCLGFPSLSLPRPLPDSGPSHLRGKVNI